MDYVMQDALFGEVRRQESLGDEGTRESELDHCSEAAMQPHSALAKNFDSAPSSSSMDFQSSATRPFGMTSHSTPILPRDVGSHGLGRVFPSSLRRPLAAEAKGQQLLQHNYEQLLENYAQLENSFDDRRLEASLKRPSRFPTSEIAIEVPRPPDQHLQESVIQSQQQIKDLQGELSKLRGQLQHATAAQSSEADLLQRISKLEAQTSSLPSSTINVSDSTSNKSKHQNSIANPEHSRSSRPLTQDNPTRKTNSYYDDDYTDDRQPISRHTQQARYRDNFDAHDDTNFQQRLVPAKKDTLEDDDVETSYKQLVPSATEPRQQARATMPSSAIKKTNSVTFDLEGENNFQNYDQFSQTRDSQLPVDHSRYRNTTASYVSASATTADSCSSFLPASAYPTVGLPRPPAKLGPFVISPVKDIQDMEHSLSASRKETEARNQRQLQKELDDLIVKAQETHARLTKMAQSLENEMLVDDEHMQTLTSLYAKIDVVNRDLTPQASFDVVQLKRALERETTLRSQRKTSFEKRSEQYKQLKERYLQQVQSIRATEGRMLPSARASLDEVVPDFPDSLVVFVPTVSSQTKSMSSVYGIKAPSTSVSQLSTASSLGNDTDPRLRTSLKSSKFAIQNDTDAQLRAALMASQHASSQVAPNSAVSASQTVASTKTAPLSSSKSYVPSLQLIRSEIDSDPTIVELRKQLDAIKSEKQEPARIKHDDFVSHISDDAQFVPPKQPEIPSASSKPADFSMNYDNYHSSFLKSSTSEFRPNSYYVPLYVPGTNSRIRADIPFASSSTPAVGIPPFSPSIQQPEPPLLKPTSAKKQSITKSVASSCTQTNLSDSDSDSVASESTIPKHNSQSHSRKQALRHSSKHGFSNSKTAHSSSHHIRSHATHTPSSHLLYPRSHIQSTPLHHKKAPEEPRSSLKPASVSRDRYQTSNVQYQEPHVRSWRLSSQALEELDRAHVLKDAVMGSNKSDIAATSLGRGRSTARADDALHLDDLHAERSLATAKAQLQDVYNDRELDVLLNSARHHRIDRQDDYVHTRREALGRSHLANPATWYHEVPHSVTASAGKSQARRPLSSEEVDDALTREVAALARKSRRLHRSLSKELDRSLDGI